MPFSQKYLFNTHLSSKMFKQKQQKQKYRFLKGVFAKDERGYRLTAKNKRL